MPKRSFDMDVPVTPVCVLPPNPKRITYSIANNGAVVVYLGADAGLTIASGEPLPAGWLVSDDKDKEAVWAVSSVGTVDLRVTEILEA